MDKRRSGGLSCSETVDATKGQRGQGMSPNALRRAQRADQATDCLVDELRVISRLRRSQGHGNAVPDRRNVLDVLLDNLLQAAHRTTDYMYIDTGVENSSLYRAATAGPEAKL